jgi:mRNA transport regulator MTR2
MNSIPQANSTSSAESLLTKLVESLDQSQQEVLPQLHNQPRIIINGQPFGSKQQFQQLWASLPASNHQITSCDVHEVPGMNNSSTFIILAHMKVRFDESGKNKLGETSLFNQQNVSSTRNIWSHWFGVSLTCVADASAASQNFNTPCVSTFDYRFTENPISSVFKVQ